MVEMAGEEAFNRALRTWARWVDRNIDPSRTRVFFRSVSPEHKRYYNISSNNRSRNYFKKQVAGSK